MEIDWRRAALSPMEKLGPSIRDILRVDSFSEQELRQILMWHFKTGTYDPKSQPRNVVLQTPAGDALYVIYGRDGDIHDIQRGPALTDEELAVLIEELKVEAGRTATCVRRHFFFSDIPVTSAYRYRDMFQISPVPTGAPLPNQTVFGGHPFLLEVRFVGTDHVALLQARSTEIVRRIELLLAILLRFDVWGELTQSRFEWTIDIDPTSVPKFRSAFRQVGYFVDGFGAFVNDLSPLDKECETVPNGDYYSPKLGAAPTSFCVPSIMTEALDSFFRLPYKLQRKFLRACFWFQKAYYLWRISESISYVAIIQAIETLITAPSGSDRCETCDRLTGPGPTALFSAFIEQHAPGLSNKQRGELYALRSAITHGDKLFVSDEDVLGHGLHPKSIAEWSRLTSTSYVVRMSLINWLLETAKTVREPEGQSV